MTVVQTLGRGRLSTPLSEMHCFPDTVSKLHPTCPHTEGPTVQMYTCVLLSVAVPFNRYTQSAGWFSNFYTKDVAIIPTCAALRRSPKPIRLQALYLTSGGSASSSDFSVDIAYHPNMRFLRPHTQLKLPSEFANPVLQAVSRVFKYHSSFSLEQIAKLWYDSIVILDFLELLSVRSALVVPI